MSTPWSRTGTLVLVLQHGLGAGVGEADVDLVLQLRGHLGLDVGGDVLLAHADHVDDGSTSGSARRRLLGDDVADRRDVDLGVAGQLLARRPVAARDPRGHEDDGQHGPRPHAGEASGQVSPRLGRVRDRVPRVDRSSRRHGGAVRRAMICSTGPYGHPSGRSVGSCGRLVTVSRRSPHWISPSSSRAASMMPASVCSRSTSRWRSELTDFSSSRCCVQPGQLVVLAEPRAHGQAEQGGADGPGDDQPGDAEEDRRLAVGGDPLLPGDRPGEVAEARPAGVGGLAARRLADHASSCGPRSRASLSQGAPPRSTSSVRDAGPCDPGTPPLRRGRPPAAAAGCTWRRGRCGPARRS